MKKQLAGGKHVDFDGMMPPFMYNRVCIYAFTYVVVIASFKESASQENCNYVDDGHNKSTFSVYFDSLLVCESSMVSMVLLTSMPANHPFSNRSTDRSKLTQQKS